MTIGVSKFETLAGTIAERAAELLGAPVAVVDERATLVAACGEGSPATSLLPTPDAANSVLRFPVRLASQEGTILVAEPADGEVLSPRLARVLVDLVVQQTTASATPRLPSQAELKNKFIYDLLRGAPRDEDDLLREAELLGLDVTRPRAVILIDARDFIRPTPNEQRRDADTDVLRRARVVIASVVKFFALPDDTICAYIGDGEVAVLKASSTRDLVAWTDRGEGQDRVAPSWANLAALKRAANGLLARLCRDTDAAINLGVGRCHPGLQGLRRSYEDARAALSLGRVASGEAHVHCLDSLGVAAFVGLPDERTKRELASYLLGPLDREPELLQTLDVFFAEDCCPSSTAQRLWIHRNTLSYRLEKIAMLTGLDPRRFDDALQIRLALVMRSLGPTAGCATA